MRQSSRRQAACPERVQGSRRAVEAVHLNDLARFRVAAVHDAAALRQRVQHALFVFRYVHLEAYLQT